MVTIEKKSQNVKKLDSNEEFNLIIDDLINNETVQKMKLFRQHYDTSCFEHCKQVAYYSYLICKKYNWDYIAVARAGMLHDLFLYNWRERQDDRKGLHAFTHPRTALNNSLKLFKLRKIEQDIILKHMWPLTVVLPKYKESYVVSMVDKYCAISESINHYKSNFKIQKLQRYAYVFFSLIVFTF